MKKKSSDEINKKYVIHKYTVIQFEEEEDEGKLFECIPDLWFVDETKSRCFWPPVTGKPFKLRAVNCEKPDDSWTEYECRVISEGHLTYVAGFKIVQEKCSQKYNTSSADEQIEAATFRRNHPGLLAQGERSIESVFVKPKLKSNDILGKAVASENGLPSIQKPSSEKNEKNGNSATVVIDNLKSVGTKTGCVSPNNSNGSKHLSPHSSDSESNNRKSRSRSRLSSNSCSNSRTPAPSTMEKQKRKVQQKQTRNISGSEMNRVASDGSCGNNNNVRSASGGRTSNPRSSRSKSRSLSSHSSWSNSRHSSPRSNNSKKSPSNKSHSRHSGSSRRSSSRRSRSRGSRSRRSRSRGSRSKRSHSRSSRSRRSRSRRSRSRSSRSRSSRSRRSRSRRSRSRRSRSRRSRSRNSSHPKKSILNRSAHSRSRRSYSNKSHVRSHSHFDLSIYNHKHSNEKMIRQQQQQNSRRLIATDSNSSKRMEGKKSLAIKKTR